MAKEKVEIELSANSAKLKSEFDQARSRVSKFTKSVRKSVLSLGGFAVGALGIRAASQVFDELSTKFDRIGKLADRFDMPVEEVQKLGVAASLRVPAWRNFPAVSSAPKSPGWMQPRGWLPRKKRLRI